MKPDARPELALQAVEVRRQRLALGLTLAQVASRAEVSIAFLSMLERGRQRPSFDRLDRVRAALGLDPALTTTAGPSRPGTRDAVETLGARLARGPATMIELGHLLGAPVSTVRATVAALSSRLVGTGLEVIEDGLAAKLAPSPGLQSRAEPPPSAIAKELSQDQYLALAVAARYGAVTRRQVDAIRGTDSHELLAGLVEHGLLSRIVDQRAPGSPHIYRLTLSALEALGVSSVEALRQLLFDRASQTQPSQDRRGSRAHSAP